MEQPKNGKIQLLQTLASSPNVLVQLGTLIMVAITGLLNLWETNQASRENQKLFERQTAEIWAALDRNKQNFRDLFENAAENRKLLVDRADDQLKLLKNQEELLRNQQVGLAILQEGQRQFLLRQQRLFKQEP